MEPDAKVLPTGTRNPVVARGHGGVDARGEGRHRGATCCRMRALIQYMDSVPYSSSSANGSVSSSQSGGQQRFRLAAAAPGIGSSAGHASFSSPIGPTVQGPHALTVSCEVTDLVAAAKRNRLQRRQSPWTRPIFQ